MRDLAADVLVVGAGMGGIPAALALARLGYTVILSEETDWLGGEVSSQGVPPDEHQYIESVGGTASYIKFRQRLRSYYRRNYPLNASSREDPQLNPGMGYVSGLCVEPRVANDVLYELLSPHLASGRIRLLMRHRAISASMRGDTVEKVCFENAESGRQVLVSFKWVLDATDLGDLLELAAVEHVTGAESQADTGELHALPGKPNPLEQQAVTWGFALDWSPHTENIIDRPDAYQRWKDDHPTFWPGPRFGWTDVELTSMTKRYRPFFAGPMTEPVLADWWHYRRIIYTEHFAAGAFPSDLTLVNIPQIDYWELPLVGVDAATRERALREARELSLSFIYWLQTEAPRHDKGDGYPEVRLRADVFGTEHGLAKQVYVREGRRILPVFRVTESHIGLEARGEGNGAEHFFDSVGIGSYRIDLHPSTAPRSYVNITSHPFEIPLGALLPVRVKNLIAAGKAIGTTHISNGAYRFQPIEWNVGESAGALVAYCLRKKAEPKQVRDDEKLLSEYQGILRQFFKIPLRWPVYEGRKGPLLRHLGLE